MTLNDLLDDGVVLQGNRIVTALNRMGHEVILYEGCAEWGWIYVDHEWMGWDINYIYPDGNGNVVIELDNPDA